MERLLIVDNDEFFRIITQETLESVVYQVESVENGELAWSRIDIAPKHFDLLLIDKSMAESAGLPLLKRIRADVRYQDLPVVILMTASQQQDIAEELADGAHYYLTKPIAKEVLVSVINNIFAEQRKNRELLSLIGSQTENMRIIHRAEFAFKNLHEAKNLALWLANVSMAPERTVNAYSELLINAVEHGNLGISYLEKGQLLKSGLWNQEIELRLQQPPYSELQVVVIMEKTLTECIVTIKDQGDGFEWDKYLQFSPERVFDLHGRGIAIAKMLGLDEIEFLGNGNTVVTKVKLDPKH